MAAAATAGVTASRAAQRATVWHICTRLLMPGGCRAGEGVAANCISAVGLCRAGVVPVKRPKCSGESDESQSGACRAVGGCGEASSTVGEAADVRSCLNEMPLAYCLRHACNDAFLCLQSAKLA